MRAYILIASVLLCVGTAAAQPVAAPVQGIALYSYGYNPDPIVLTAGKAVTLNFVNRGTKGHDFTAKKFFRSSRIISGNVGEGEVDLGPGRSASVTLVPAAGRYKVHCGHPFHKMLGMSGDIVVR
jgi:plastocyanin